MLGSINVIFHHNPLQSFNFISGKFYKQFYPFVARKISSQRCLRSNYEGDGKTVITVLNREHKELIMIDSISNFGFRLNNGMFVVGPIAVFPKSVLQWNIKSFESITLETLSLFYMLEPKIDILVVGTGDKQERLSKEVLQFFQRKKIGLEVLKTEHACSTFNFLNVERRYVAAAFMPPNTVYISPEEFQLLGTDEGLEVASFNLSPGEFQGLPEQPPKK